MARQVMTENLRRPVAPGRPRPARRRFAGSRRSRRGLTGVLLVAPAAILIAGLFVVPLVLDGWMSLNNWPLLGSHSFTGLTNYRDLFGDSGVRHALLFTVIFTVVIVPLVFLVGLAMASFLQHSRPGVAVFRAAVIAPVTIGFATASYLWLSLIDPNTGIFDRILLDIHVVSKPVNWLSTSALALAVVVVLTVWKLAGFAMIVLINGLQGVPTEVEEAARIDGARWLRILWSIKLPLMRRSIVLALVFVALAGFLSFDQFYILTGGAPNNSTITAVFRIYDTAFVQGNLGYASALSIVLLVIVLIITGLELALLPKKGDA
jgi:multiple sugar transport system permease protein